MPQVIELQRRAILLELSERLLQAGGWCGETHIQKATYFLQELMRVPLQFRFILYKHGPYSFDLKDEILTMLTHGFLKVQPQPYPYGSSIVPGDLAPRLKSRFPPEYTAALDFVFAKLRDKKVAELERLATALLVRLQGSKAGGEVDRSQLLCELKPHIPAELAPQALAEIDRIVEEAGTRVEL